MANVSRREIYATSRTADNNDDDDDEEER